jgi:hypothetical protein
VKRASFAAALVAALVPSLALAMTTGEFVAKADMMAMMSSDVGLLQAEMKSVGMAWRADVDAARAKGDKRFGCPPPKGQSRMTPDELITAFRAVPAATPVKLAFYRHMAQKFPCR